MYNFIQCSLSLKIIFYIFKCILILYKIFIRKTIRKTLKSLNTKQQQQQKNPS